MVIETKIRLRPASPDHTNGHKRALPTAAFGRRRRCRLVGPDLGKALSAVRAVRESSRGCRAFDSTARAGYRLCIEGIQAYASLRIESATRLPRLALAGAATLCGSQVNRGADHSGGHSMNSVKVQRGSGEVVVIDGADIEKLKLSLRGSLLVAGDEG